MRTGVTMTKHLRRILLLGVVLGLALTGRQSMAVDEIFLLPDDDGTTGSIVISGGGMDTTLDEPRSKVTLYSTLLRQTLTGIPESQIQSVFGGVLSILIGADNPLDTLPEIVNLTLATHPAFMEMVHERQARDELTNVAQGGFRPRINVRGDIGQEWTRNPTTTLFTDDYIDLSRREVEIGLRQTVFDGWATFSEFDRRQAAADASAYQLQALGERISAQVADVYVNLLRDNDLLELANKNMATHEEYLDKISARSGSGVGRGADLDQVEARLAGSQSDVINSETDLKDTLVRYLNLVGYPPLEVLIRPEPTKMDLPASLEAALEMAVREHPAIIATEAAMEESRQQLRNAKSLYWPRIEVGVSTRYGDDLDGVRGFDQDVQLMLYFNYNLYNGGADKAKIQRSVYTIEQARNLREDTIREVRESVRQSWNAFTSTERRMASLERHVSSMGKARDAYREQFRIGDRSLLDVLDGEIELYRSRRTLVEARRDYATALYRLRASMGTLVDHFAAETPREAQPSMEYVRTH